MAKLTKIIRSTDPVSETDANAVFELLVPIVETDPSAHDAVETAGDVISRCGLSDDRLLSHVLDWWYVTTTGRPSANGGAHRLPDSFDGRLRDPMKAAVSLDAKVPAAEWIEKRDQLNTKLSALDDDLQRDHEVWSLLSEQLGGTVNRLKAKRRADTVEFEERKLEQMLRERGPEGGSRRYKQMLKRCREMTDDLNRIVELQTEVEPWIRRPKLERISEVPNEFKHAVGPLAEDLLRPILTANAAPSVDREKVTAAVNAAGRSGDRRGRYRLARVVDKWCEHTGQSVESLEEELRRHRALVSALDASKAKPDLPDDAGEEVRGRMLDDDLDGAEKALERLHKEIARREQVQIATRQLEGLRRSLQELGLSEDAGWIDRVAEIEARFEADDPREITREIGASQTELSAQLDDLLKEQQEELRRLLEPLDDLRASDSTRRDWEQRISELERGDSRRASELKQELEGELQRLRDEHEAAARRDLEWVQATLTDEREDFSEEIVGSFDNRHSEIEGSLQDPDLNDGHLVEARDKARELLNSVEVRRIQRWQADQGEAELVDHLVKHCTGTLDFDRMDIQRLYVSLKTRPFVILAGLTGSGKSSLTRSFAEALGASGSNGRFRRIAVRPDWIDQSEVLGFVNPISERFVPGWLAETVRDCEREPDRLHFVLLDEMNLAPVEQYLAEWLSAIEEARSGSEDVCMPLYSSALSPKNADDWAPSIKFPDNLMIVGTVNVDETTRPLSERVLDRANVLLLNVEVSNRHHEPGGQAPAPRHVGVTEWQKICKTEPSDDHHEFLVELADILRHAGIGVGLRTHIELERFIANADGIIDPVDALDWGIVQRIIPKIRGFKGHLLECLEELLQEFDKVGAKQSAAIVGRWLDDELSNDEFLEGTDPRLALARI